MRWWLGRLCAQPPKQAPGQLAVRPLPKWRPRPGPLLLRGGNGVWECGRRNRGNVASHPQQDLAGIDSCVNAAMAPMIDVLNARGSPTFESCIGTLGVALGRAHVGLRRAEDALAVLEAVLSASQGDGGLRPRCSARCSFQLPTAGRSPSSCRVTPAVSGSSSTSRCRVPTWDWRQRRSGTSGRNPT